MAISGILGRLRGGEDERIERFVANTDALVKVAESPFPEGLSVQERKLFLRNMDEAAAKLTVVVKDFFESVVCRLSGEIHPQDRKRISEWMFGRCSRFLSAGAIDSQMKQRILKNVISHVVPLLERARMRTLQDTRSGALERLGVSRDATIVRMWPLGSETHLHKDQSGQIPLAIEFSNGKTIVYKPRSMLSEYLLCDREEGVLSSLGWGVYPIVCNIDEHGAFGYAEFLTRTDEKENLIRTAEEGIEYIRKLHILDALASQLKIGDLHCDNIMTIGRIPYLIDTEVELGTREQSLIFDAEVGAAHRFFNKDLFTESRISFSEEMLSALKDSEKSLLDLGICNLEIYKNMGIDVAKIRREEVAFSSEIDAKIARARLLLSLSTRRLVPISTQELLSFLAFSGKGKEQSMCDFEQVVRKCLKKIDPNVRFVPDFSRILDQRFREDQENMDVPVFQKKGLVVYCDGQEIAYLSDR